MLPKKSARERLRAKLVETRTLNAKQCVEMVSLLRSKDQDFQAGLLATKTSQERLTFVTEAINSADQVRKFLESSHLLVLVDGVEWNKTDAHKSYALWQVRIAEEYYFQGRKDEASKAVREAEKLQHPYCYYLLGRLCEPNQKNRASEYYAKVLEIFQKPTHYMEYRYLGQAQLRLAKLGLSGNQDPVLVEKLMLSAIENLKNANYDNALSVAHQALGTLYAEGPESLRQVEKAYACFEAAIALNDGFAHFNLAMVMLVNAPRTPENVQRIEQLLINACKLSADPEPRFHLAGLYDSIGRKELAVEHYKKCGEFPAALHNLSACYARGEGMVAPDKEASLVCLRLAVEKHHFAGAAIDYASALFERGGKANIRQAQKALRFARKEGIPYAEHNIAYYIKVGLWPTCSPFNDALAYFIEAAEKGLWESQINCAMYLIAENDFQGALGWIQRAATHPESESTRFFLGNYILHLIEEYNANPSLSLRTTIEFLAPQLALFKEAAPVARQDEDTILFEDLTATKCQGAGDFASIKTEYERSLAEFQRFSHQQFKALNQKLSDTQRDDTFTPLYKVQQLLEEITEAGDIDLINVLTALQSISRLLSAHRFDTVMFASNYPKLLTLYRFIGKQDKNFKTTRDLVDAFTGLSKLHLASRIHDEVGCLDWLLPQLLEGLCRDPNPGQITAVLAALHRVGKTKALLATDMSAFFQVLVDNVPQFSREQLSTLCHALAVLHNQCRFVKSENKPRIEVALSALLLRASREIDCAQLSEAHRHAWYLAYSYAERFHLIKSPLVREHQQYFQKNPAHLLCVDKISGSLLQDEITEFIARHFKKLKTEYAVNGLIIDIYLDNSLDSVIIHVDGPGHYLYDPDNLTGELTGKDLFRDTLLGKRVVHINYREWENCHNDAERAKLLITKLFSFKVKIPDSLTQLLHVAPTRSLNMQRK